MVLRLRCLALVALLAPATLVLSAAAEPQVNGQDTAGWFEAAERAAFAGEYAQAAALFLRELRRASAPRDVSCASGRLVTCLLRCNQQPAAFLAVEQAARKTAGTLEEASQYLMLGRLYNTARHGEATCGHKHPPAAEAWPDWTDWGHDTAQAVAAFERARELLAALSARTTTASAEATEAASAARRLWLACDFDLAAQISKQRVHRTEYLEDATIYAELPAAYERGAPGYQRQRALFSEIERVDSMGDRESAARALYERAMAARLRFSQLSPHISWSPGVEWQYDPARQDLRERVRSLEDNQVLLVRGGPLRTISLPDEDSPPWLLGQVARRYPRSRMAPEALYSLSIYYLQRGQYAKAVAAFREVELRYAAYPAAVKAHRQLERLFQPEFHFGATGIQAAGSASRVSLWHRNLRRVRFTARPVDLAAVTRTWLRKLNDDRSRAVRYGALDDLTRLLLWSGSPSEFRVERFLQGQPLSWEAELPATPDHSFTQTQLQTPLDRPGCWLIEATSPEVSGSQRTLLQLSKVALVQRWRRSRGLLCWAVEAATGKPIAGIELRHARAKSGSAGELWVTTRTDARGLGEFPAGAVGEELSSHLPTIAAEPLDTPALARTDYCSFEDNRTSDESFGSFVLTDRPAYRPGSRIRVKGWDLPTGGAKSGGPSRRLSFTLGDSRGRRVAHREAQVDEFQGASAELELPEEAVPGAYSVSIGNYNREPVRVEEYRKPEARVEVTVSPDRAADHCPSECRIAVRFGSGHPVAGALVDYRLLVKPTSLRRGVPAEWDWLFGRGYGQTQKVPWWLPGRRDFVEVSETVEEPREGIRWDFEATCVRRGRGSTNPAGLLVVGLDGVREARADFGGDSLLRIEAVATDASSRVTRGHLEVPLAANCLRVELALDRGFYPAGAPLQARVWTGCLCGPLPSVTGEIEVLRLAYGPEGRLPVVATRVEGNPLQLAGGAVMPCSLQGLPPGQYEVRATVRGLSGAPAVAARLVWVVGPGLDITEHRTHGLELLAERPTYLPGETARVLVACSRPAAAVLAGPRSSGGSSVTTLGVHALDKGWTILDFPVPRQTRRNSFVEAFAVWAGELMTGAAELRIPPEDGVLNVKLETDRPVYAPGDEVGLSVQVRDRAGKPAHAQVALAVFDGSVAFEAEPSATHLLSLAWRVLDRFGPQHSSSLEPLLQPMSLCRDPAEPESLDVVGYTGLHAPWVPDLRCADLDSANGLLSVWQPEDGPRLAPLPFVPCPPRRPGLAPMGRTTEGSWIEHRGPRRRFTGRPELERGHASACLSSVSVPIEPPPMVELVPLPTRYRFLDTAVWEPSLRTDSSGTARVRFRLPDNLALWSVRAVAVSTRPAVGEARTQLRATRPFVLLPHLPRFLIAGDTLELEASVQADSGIRGPVVVSARVTGGPLALKRELPREVSLSSGLSSQVSWSVTALASGVAKVHLEAAGAEQSDATEVALPIHQHGTRRFDVRMGMLGPEGPASWQTDFDFASSSAPGLSSLRLVIDPALLRSQAELLSNRSGWEHVYPRPTPLARIIPETLLWSYRIPEAAATSCVDSRLDSRTLPAGCPENWRVKGVPAGLYAEHGVRQLCHSWWEQELQSAAYSPRPGPSEALSSARAILALSEMERAGFSLSSSARSRLTSRMTALAPVDAQAWVKYGCPFHGLVEFALALAKEGRTPSHLDLLLQRIPEDMPPGEAAMLALALFHLERRQEAQAVLDRLGPWWPGKDTPGAGGPSRTPRRCDLCTGPLQAAWLLQALQQLRPADPRISRLLEWLLQNRARGRSWLTAGESAVAEQGLGSYLRALSGREFDRAVRVTFDNAEVKRFTPGPESAVGPDSVVEVAAASLSPGLHRLRVEREGRGLSFLWALATQVVTGENPAPVANRLELTSTWSRTAAAPGGVDSSQAGPTAGTQSPTAPAGELQAEEAVHAGEQLQVAVELRSAETLHYVAVEIPKPAGCEVEREASQAHWNSPANSPEVRDDRVLLYLDRLSPGSTRVAVKMRAEFPGRYHVLPVRAWSVFAPEVFASGRERALRIVRQPR